MVDYLPIVTLIEYILTLICGVMSIYYFGMILYWNTFKKLSLGMNISMKLYVIIEFIFAVFTTIYAICFSVYWRPVENIYNAYVIFFTGGTVTVLLVTEPVVACFLGIERCLCLIFPFKNTKLCSLIITILTVICCGIFTALIIPFHIMTGWPSKAETNCRSFGCMQSSTGQMYSILRYTTSVSSVFIGVFLIWLFQAKTSKSFSIKNTRLVVITVIAAILFDFIPHFISFCLTTFAEINLTKLIGPYSTLVSSINCFVCGLSYYQTMRSSMKMTTMVIESSNTNTIKSSTVIFDNSSLLCVTFL